MLALPIEEQIALRERQEDELRQQIYRQAMSCYLAGTKEAAVAEVDHALAGRLYLSESNWLLLSVPNAVVRGLFDAMDETGIELPTKDGKLNAHISVMRPEEVTQIGGAEKITERGHSYRYNLGPIKCVRPSGWENIARVWYATIVSPELQELRRSYGLSSLPKEGKHDFHVTVAVRRAKVLQNNTVTKV